MLSSPRARPFEYVERGMRSINALRWAKNTIRADRWARIVRGMVCRHHSVPFGTAPSQRFLATRCSNICDGVSRSFRRGQLFSIWFGDDDARRAHVLLRAPALPHR